MKLNEVELLRLLPQFMREDKNAQAFAYSVNKEILRVVINIKYASIYSRIDELTDEILDELAWQFNVTEYSNTYDISVKRDLIRNCMLIHHQRGTVGAVEKVVKNIFGDARVEEWFDYNGEPYHFKVYTSNASASDEMLAEFDRIIKSTQNCRSYLEVAVIELFQTMDLFYGATCSIGSIDTFICEG